MNMQFYRKLPIPKEIKEQYPLNDALIAHREGLLKELKDIFEGKSARKVLIVGPCSADHSEPVLEYISR